VYSKLSETSKMGLIKLNPGMFRNRRKCMILNARTGNKCSCYGPFSKFRMQSQAVSSTKMEKT
jgi:hypothetical protein